MPWRKKGVREIFHRKRIGWVGRIKPAYWDNRSRALKKTKGQRTYLFETDMFSDPFSYGVFELQAGGRGGEWHGMFLVELEQV